MSLILEALKKLERDKEAPDRGFLVLAHLPFVAAPRRPARALVLGAAAVLAVAALGLAWWRSSRPAPSASAIPPAVEATTTAPSIVPIAPRTPVAAPAPRPRAALPASPPAVARTVEPPVAPPAVQFKLNAISEQDGKPVAILNDRLVREGDVFEGVRIVRIGEAEVEIEFEGVRQVIRF